MLIVLHGKVTKLRRKKTKLNLLEKLIDELFERLSFEQCESSYGDKRYSAYCQRPMNHIGKHKDHQGYRF